MDNTTIPADVFVEWATLRRLVVSDEVSVR